MKIYPRGENESRIRIEFLLAPRIESPQEFAQDWSNANCLHMGSSNNGTGRLDTR